MHLRSIAGNQSYSPLLCLPAELRTTIYEHVLGNQEITIGMGWTPAHCKRPRMEFYTGPLDVLESTDVTYNHSGCEWLRSDDTTRLLALHGTCRQIYQETSGMWFALNTFQGSADAITSFIMHPNTRTHHIQTIRLQLFSVVRFGSIPMVSVGLSAEPYELLALLKLLKGLKQIFIALPKLERPIIHTDQAVLTEIRRVFELDRVGEHVQITLEAVSRWLN